MAAPVIAVVGPTPGTIIADSRVVTFDVTDADDNLARVFVVVTFVGLRLTELAHAGDADYREAYRATSTRAVLTHGYRYALLRNPLWPDSPSVTVYATDAAGAETVATFAWTLAAPPAALDPRTSIVPTFPPGGAAGPVDDVAAYDAAHFLALYDRVLPADYVEPMKDVPDGGYEVLQAAAAAGARLSTAVARTERGNVIIYARGGSYSLAMVEFYRETASAGAVVIGAGTTVTTSRAGRDFVTLDDAVFTALALGPVAVRARAVVQAWEWDVPGRRITPRGEVLEGEIDTVRRFVQFAYDATADARTGDVTFIDPNVWVRQIADAAGGAAPMLDGLGADRGVVRSAGEPDELYVQRIRTLPDTVSPDAINRAVTALLAPYGAAYAFIETWQVEYQTCYDAPEGTYPATSPGYDPNLFCYDDPRPAYGAGLGHLVPPGAPFYNRWLDSIEQFGAFVVVVPVLPCIHDVGMAYDDTATIPEDFAVAATHGRRAYGAYDVPDTFDPVFGLQGGYDGFDPAAQGVYFGLFQKLQQIKLGGVAALVEFQGS